jgi:ornithine decarboxylase
MISGLVEELMIQRVQQSDDAFFVADLGEVVRQWNKWTTLLPRVEPFFAMKCNPDPRVVELLCNLKTGFDCASKTELEMALANGVPADKIIFANPCKLPSHIRFAAEVGVRMMTFDNADELHKIKRWHPTAQLVLRIVTDDTYSICKFSSKFGATPSSASRLLALAKELALDIIGVSFHVGSACGNPVAFENAVCSARKVFEEGKALGFEMRLLDVGGGFPGKDTKEVAFADFAKVLGDAVDSFFPEESVRVIAEPGRYFVTSAFTLAVQVIARRCPTDDEKSQFMYYINDGMYGSFNCITFDHAADVFPKVLVRNGKFLYGQDAPFEPTSSCSVWGPTCDSIDCITKSAVLPEMQIGDWLYFPDMGAYTIAAASSFNGFQKSEIIYTNTETRNSP